MILWVLPHNAWCVHGTVVSFGDILLTASRPLATGIVAGGLAFGVRLACGQLMPPLPRLVLESSVVLVTFLSILLFVTGQKAFYVDLLGNLLQGRRASTAGLAVAPARRQSEPGSILT